nr:MOSC domain-containing protein [Armatimonadota bacterium]
MTPHLPSGLIDTLHAAQNVTALTGAGVSAESGLPTFRDAMTGLWAQYRPEDLATPKAFQHNPKLVWDWYAWGGERAAQAAPNPAHLALTAMARHVPNFTLITQNADGLHQRAGSPNVIELHGNIHRAKCFHEGTVFEEGWQDSKETPPHCPRYGGLLRPTVFWFGENLRNEGMDVNQARVGERWQIGDHVEVEVTMPRTPCSTFARWVGGAEATGWVKRFSDERRLGAYLRVTR